MKAKKLLSILLSLSLLVGALSAAPFTASAAADAGAVVGASSGTTGDCSWRLSSGTLIISGEGDMQASYSWGEAPWGNSVMTVIVMDGVTSISAQAFAGNTNLTTVQLAESVEIIRGNAFNACSNLKSINLPYGLRELENHVFFNCSALERLIMPDTLETLGINLCCYCTSLTELRLSESLTGIELADFYGCTALESVDIPDSVTRISGSAFKGCEALADITLPEHVSSISATSFESTAWMDAQPDGIFYYDSIAVFLKGECPQSFEIARGTRFIAESFLTPAESIENLVSVSLPEGIPSIPYNTFNGCSSLSRINIPSSVTSIGESAFQNCSSLESVSLGGNITTIQSSAFAYTGLRSVALPSKLTTLYDYVFGSCAQLESVTIPASLKTMGTGDFSGCVSLTEFEVPDTLTRLGASTFNECISLQSVKLGSGITEIGEKMFYGCTSLESVVISGELKNIGRYAFYRCSALEAIDIPETLMTTGDSAFGCCSSLKRVDLPEGFSFYLNYYPTSGVFANCVSLERVTVPRGVSYIRDDTFEGCTNLTIYGYKDSYAQTFAGNNNIPFRAIDATGDCVWSVENNVLTITGSGATADYSEENPAPWGNEITEVVIADGVTRIGAYAFFGCERLAAVTVPDSVVSIGEKALHNTRWLSRKSYGIAYAGEVAYTFAGGSPSKLRIKDGTVAVADSAFEELGALAEVTIPDSLASIGAKAFKNCSSLGETEILNNVTSIGENAFEGCGSLVILGYGDTAAKTYAESNGIPFTQIGEKTGSCRWRQDGEILTVFGSGTMETHVFSANVTFPWSSDVREIVIGENVKLGIGSLTACKNIEKVTVLNDSASLSSIISSYLPSEKNYTLYGFSGSTAQTFADNKNVPFVKIGEKGDPSLDAEVNVNDATLTQKYIAKAKSFNSHQITAADTNGDGAVNIIDVTLIQKAAAGLIEL